MQAIRRITDNLRGNLLGYGLCRAWVLLHFAFSWGGKLLELPFGASNYMSLWTLFFSMTLSAALFSCTQKSPMGRFAVIVPELMIACGFIGTSLVAYGSVTGIEALFLVGLFFAGVCGGHFEASWGLYFVHMGKDALCCNVLFSILLCSSIALLVSLLVPTRFFFIVAYALLVGMAILDRRCKISMDEETVGSSSEAHRSSLKRIFLPILAASTLYALVQSGATILEVGTTAVPENFTARSIARFSAAFALLAYLMVKRSIKSLELSKVVLLLTVVGLFLILSNSESTNRSAHFILVFGNELFETLVWILVIESVSMFGVSARTAFGSIVAARNAAFLAGSILAAIVSANCSPDNTVWTAFVLALLLLLVVALFRLLSEKPLQSLVVAEEEHLETQQANSRPRDNDGLATLARNSGFTARETDVFLLLARGKNRSSIADELAISQNTVHSHILHVYQKLGVHDQQELIKLVDEKAAQ